MPSATSVPPHLELLTFLSDANAQVRSVALSNLVGLSAKTNAQRTLLTDKHKGNDGKPLQGRDGGEVDTIEDLKRLCRDQPMTAHHAFCALINLSDSLMVARRIGDAAFIDFLVRYIADPASLLTDLACMLLSNLTKLESIGATLLTLEVPAQPLRNFLSDDDVQASMEALSVEPDDPEYDAKRRRAEESSARMALAAQQEQYRVPALSVLLDAFEEGADVAGGESQASTIEEMRTRAREIQLQGTATDGANGKAPNGDAASALLGYDDEQAPTKRRSNCNFLASVFANITTVPKGRQMFVTRMPAAASKVDGDAVPAPARDYPIARLVVYSEHPDLIRRGGVVSTLKNVFFVKTAHPLLFAPPPPTWQPTEEALKVAATLPPLTREPSSIDVLPYVLLPLCDGRELAKLDLDEQETLPDECQLMDEGKRRERDPALRLMLVEALLLLCTTLYGRQTLRGRGVYVVVREAHLEEKDEKVAEAVVRLVNILKRDESESSLRESEEEIGAEAVEEDAEDEEDEDLAIEEL